MRDEAEGKADSEAVEVGARRSRAAAGGTFREDGHRAVDWAADYLDRVGDLPVLAQVRPGDIRAKLPARNEIICTLDDERTPALARALKTTRSAAAVELWGERLAGAVVAIGNAPTALFHLLERLGREQQRPAAILAFPVGFVGAAESKQALIDARLGIPFLTLKGRRGGSALAAAAVNALLIGSP